MRAERQSIKQKTNVYLRVAQHLPGNGIEARGEGSITSIAEAVRSRVNDANGEPFLPIPIINASPAVRPLGVQMILQVMTDKELNLADGAGREASIRRGGEFALE